jgi:hypothetical protein
VSEWCVRKVDTIIDGKEYYLYYGGYFSKSISDSGVIWRKSLSSKNCRFDLRVAEQIQNQLGQMGIDATIKEIRRKRQRGAYYGVDQCDNDTKQKLT